MDNENYSKFSQFYFDSFFTRLLWSSSERNRIKNILDIKYGVKRADDVQERVSKSLKSLSLLLDDQEYFFGKSPSSLDANAYGILYFYKNLELPNDILKNLLEKHSNLLNYLTRMEKQFENKQGFIELEKTNRKTVEIDKVDFDYTKTYITISIFSVGILGYYYSIYKNRK